MNDSTSSGPEASNDQGAIERVLEELTEPGAFGAAEQRVLDLAPQLQKVLDVAIMAGGWFDDAHEAAVLQAATAPDNDRRITAVRNLVSEQTRLGMLVGVAVGMEIAQRLAERVGQKEGRSEERPDGQ